jgi:RNA polymerase sigma factor (sigma-70 family)
MADTAAQQTALKVLFGDDHAAYQQFLQEDLARAYDFAARELRYHDAINTLSANELDPYDIVDQAVLELLQEKPGSLKPGKRLVSRILSVIHREVSKLEERERREISVEGEVHDPAEEAGVRTIGEHVLDFWQPDQDQTTLDIIADTEVPTPAEILDMKERQHDVYAALASLPRTWREDFVLRAVEGWTLDEIATHRGASSVVVGSNLRMAQAFLLERLREKSQVEGRTPRQLPHTHDRG